MQFGSDDCTSSTLLIQNLDLASVLYWNSSPEEKCFTSDKERAKNLPRITDLLVDNHGRSFDQDNIRKVSAIRKIEFWSAITAVNILSLTRYDGLNF